MEVKLAQKLSQNFWEPLTIYCVALTRFWENNLSRYSWMIFLLFCEKFSIFVKTTSVPNFFESSPSFFNYGVIIQSYCEKNWRFPQLYVSCFSREVAVSLTIIAQFRGFTLNYCQSSVKNLTVNIIWSNQFTLFVERKLVDTRDSFVSVHILLIWVSGFKSDKRLSVFYI